MRKVYWENIYLGSTLPRIIAPCTTTSRRTVSCGIVPNNSASIYRVLYSIPSDHKASLSMVSCKWSSDSMAPGIMDPVNIVP